ncbi:hypothetical protein [Kitasatospora sp. McL0602]|uniref:hypothetical protein n=1 Tax=Kitasatospora sp. McL0602 TaxID=3439530 RepID=UPI003F8C3736
MASSSFRIDFAEVEAASKLIHNMLADLEEPANRLEAVVKQVQKSVYGTDLLGKSLTGGTSSVGGVGEHQDQVLAGIRAYIANTTVMAQNLQHIVDTHRSNDDEQATELHGILKDNGTPQTPGATRTGTITPAVTVGVPATPATPPQTPDFTPPPPPKLDYNPPKPPPVDRPPVGGGRHPLET